MRATRTLSALLLISSLVAGMTAATPAPADAASAVTGCFVSSKAGYDVVGIPGQLQAYYLGTWVTIMSSPLTAGKCVAWTIGPGARGYHLRLVVNYQAYGASWSGVSPLMALPGDLSVHLGTGVVTCRGCGY